MRTVTPNGGLDALFRPRSVAIIGASDDAARIGGRPLRYLRESGFAGPVWPVNPTRRTVQGVPAYASLANVAGVPDVALIAVPAAAVPQAMRDCASHGVKAAIVFSAGFGETGEAGRAVQAEVMAIARAAGIRVLGPNCLGVHSAIDRFVGTFGSILDRGLPDPGPIGIVSQSGAFGMYLAYLTQSRGLGVSHAITTGNEADVDLSESLMWLVRQPHVKVVMVHAESIRDGNCFIAALREAHKARKPVIVMKVGVSPAGAQAASSHTDALAGSDAVFGGILRQYGAYRAWTTEEQIDVAYAAANGIFPAGNRLGVVTGSGGVGVHMCDAADRFGLAVPPLPSDAQAQILDMLPFASPTNPVDVTAQALSDMSVLERSLRIVLEKGGYDAVIAAFLGLPLARPFAAPLRDALVRGAKGHSSKLFVLNVNADKDVVHDYEAQGFLVFEDATRAVRAVAALRELHRAFDTPLGSAGATAGHGRQVALPAELDELNAKRILADAGLPVLREELVRDADAAVAAWRTIGAPVAMKIVSPAILHKTEIGGVVLDIDDDTAVRRSFDLLMERGLANAPADQITGVLVSPMAGDGVETIVGVSRDPVFGPVVMFGLGGILVEVLRDVTFRRAPFGLGEAQRMINEIAGRAMLDGVRGRPPADTDALAQALATISVFAAENVETIDSIDINPLLVRPQGQGVAALDAVIVPRGQSGKGSARV